MHRHYPWAVVMQTGIPNPIPIIQPVSIRRNIQDPQQIAMLRVLKDLTDYTNLLNQGLMTIVPIRTVGVSYGVQLTDRVINIDASAGNVVITLLSPGAYQDSNVPIWGDYVVELKRIDASLNTVTVIAVNGARIDGQVAITMIQWNYLRLRPYALYGSDQFTQWGIY
jgi:hypothetical protein